MNEENNSYNWVGNGSSVFKTIGLTIAGFTTPWLIKLALQYFGIDLSGQETQIMQSLGVLIGLALSYIDMKFSNTFFKKEITLADYEKYGQEKFGVKVVDDVIDDVDTAGEYDDLDAEVKT
jgi:hypothetical protein